MRLISAVLILLVAAFVAPSPASAGGIVTTVVSKSKLPTSPQVVQAVRESCPPASPAVLSSPTTAYRHVSGPVLVPLGHGSLRINPAANVVPGLRVSSSASLANLTALRVDMYGEIQNLYDFMFVTTADTHDWVLSLYQPGLAPYDWTTYDLYANPNWFWTDLNNNNTDFGSLAAFTTAHAVTTGFKVEMRAGGNCNSISQVPTWFDDLEVGINGNTAKYDFEGPPGLTIKANHSTIAAGDSVKLSTVFTDGGTPVQGRHVGLFAKPQGAASFTKVREFYPTTAGGGAFETLKPSKTTTYQWRYGGGDPIEPTRSHPKTVHVTH